MTKKSAAQLDAEIKAALRDKEHAQLQEDFRKLDPHLQERVLRAQEISAFGEQLEEAGLRLHHASDGYIHVKGKAHAVKDVLKKYGFRYEPAIKEWTLRYAPRKLAGELDYLSLYADLMKVL